MNKHLDEAIARVRALPDDRQREAAELLFEFIANQHPDFYLSPEQIGEIERRMSEDGPYATEEEVRAVFDRPRNDGPLRCAGAQRHQGDS